MICALIKHQSESLICTTYTVPSGGSIVDCFNIAGNLSYRHIGAALHADLSFDLSFDEDILNNLDHWFNLQTFGMGILVSTEDLPFVGYCRYCLPQRL